MDVVVRDEIGKRATKALRRDGRVPCVVYGSSNTNVHISAVELDLAKIVNVSSIVSLKPDAGDSRDVMVKDVQRNCITGALIHVDFFEITYGQAMSATVPVEVHGEAAGISHGGRLEVFMHEITVSCMPKDLPSSLPVDVSALELDDSINIGNFAFPKGVEAPDYDENTLVLMVQSPRVHDDEAAAEGEAEGAAGGEEAEGEAAEGEEE
jgi:large subunit ribosomal protein L25